MANSLTTPTPEATEASSSGLPLAIIAGGAGAAILIVVIVIIVVVRRKKSKPDTKIDATRKVVAFENPMYEAAAKVQPDSQGIYDNHGNASEGLYDEPAFVDKTDKSNPLYESTDALNTQEQVYDDPHLGFDHTADIAPPDSGYLDVTD